MTGRLLCLIPMLCANLMGAAVPAVAEEVQDLPSGDPYASALEQLGSPSVQTMDNEPIPIMSGGTNSLQLRVLFAGTRHAIDTFTVSLESLTHPEAVPSGILHDLLFPESRRFESVTDAVTINGLPQGDWLVFIYSPSYIRHVEQVSTPHEGVVEMLLIPKRGRVRGRVLDGATQQPLEGVTVRLYLEEVGPEGGGPMVGMGDAAVPPTSTDRNGMFQLEPLAGAGYRTVIHVEQAGYFEHTIDIPAGQVWKEDLGDILLSPVSALDGRVLDVGGRPLANYPVSVIHGSIPYQDVHAVAQALRGGGKRGNPLARRYRTDGDGVFRSERMEGGAYMVVFGDLDHNAQRVELKDGEVKSLTFQQK